MWDITFANANVRYGWSRCKTSNNVAGGPVGRGRIFIDLIIGFLVNHRILKIKISQLWNQWRKKKRPRFGPVMMIGGVWVTDDECYVSETLRSNQRKKKYSLLLLLEVVQWTGVRARTRTMSLVQFHEFWFYWNKQLKEQSMHVW